MAPLAPQLLQNPPEPSALHTQAFTQNTTSSSPTPPPRPPRLQSRPSPTHSPHPQKRWSRATPASSTCATSCSPGSGPSRWSVPRPTAGARCSPRRRSCGRRTPAARCTRVGPGGGGGRTGGKRRLRGRAGAEPCHHRVAALSLLRRPPTNHPANRPTDRPTDQPPTQPNADCNPQATSSPRCPRRSTSSCSRWAGPWGWRWSGARAGIRKPRTRGGRGLATMHRHRPQTLNLSHHSNFKPPQNSYPTPPNPLTGARALREQPRGGGAAQAGPLLQGHPVTTAGDAARVTLEDDPAAVRTVALGAA